MIKTLPEMPSFPGCPPRMSLIARDGRYFRISQKIFVPF
jgi:hypothetical protein